MGRLKAGWYPDPSTEGRQQRYWDGSDWTDRVQSYAAPSSGSGAPKQRAGSGKRIALPLMILIAAGVVVYAMIRNQDVEEIGVGESGLSVKFSSSRSISSSEIEAKQGQLEERLISLEEQAQTEAAAEPTAPETVDLNGDWTGNNGYIYRIQQYGTQAVISELSPYGITAVGQGVIQGKFATFSYQAADGSIGQAELQMTNSATLEGTFTNLTYGVTTPARMTR